MSGGDKTASDNRNIYLAGFMASGKSTIGKILAAISGREFRDTDSIIEGKAGERISEIFRKNGEAYFRALESDAIKTASKMKRGVIALGGGAFIRDENRRIIQESGVTVYLRWDPQILLERLSSDSERPLVVGTNDLAWRENVLRLYNSRRPLYERANYIIECEADHSPEQIASRILKRLS